jgi:hypothetical protein
MPPLKSRVLGAMIYAETSDMRSKISLPSLAKDLLTSVPNTFRLGNLILRREVSL